MEEIELLKKKKSWYKRWWGMTLIALFILSAIFLPFYIYQFVTLYKQYKAGVFLPLDIVKENAPYEMEVFLDEMSPWTGNKDAKIKIIEFGDFNCGQTLKAFPIVRELTTKYQDKVQFYWRNLPIMNESSIDLAKASICAHKQNKFWAFHDKLFQQRSAGKEFDLMQMVLKMGFDQGAFNECLNNKLTLAQIKKDYYSAEDGQIRGTPTFLINGYKIEGAIPLELWDDIIEKFLAIYEKAN